MMRPRFSSGRSGITMSAGLGRGEWFAGLLEENEIQVGCSEYIFCQIYSD